MIGRVPAILGRAYALLGPAVDMPLIHDSMIKCNLHLRG